MRARHRHFNPRHAGADLVLDARYIDQSDNTEVSSWADRSANAHTIQQTNSTMRPTFQTNELNGNPVVRFDGSNDFLTGGDILDVLTNNLTVVCVGKIAGGTNPTYFAKARFAGGAGRYGMLRENNNSFFLLFTDTGIRSASVADTSAANRIHTQVVVRGATNTLFFDGAQQAQNTALSGSGSLNSTDVFLVGAYGNSTGTTPPQATYYLNGDIAQLVVNFTDNTPLRKRMEHAAAYSFKIACN